MFKNHRRKIALILVCIGLAACASTPNVVEKPDTEEYAPIQQLSQSSKPYSKGGLLSEKAGLNLFDDRRAYRAGDIITVILNERTISSKSTETKIDKDSKVEFGADSILGQAVTLNNNPTSTNVNQSRGFDGAAEADQENRLLGSIAVTVTDVLPNDLLVIRGEKWMTLTNGEEFIRLSGLIRPDDVASNNTISSTKVADARISYSGTGDLASVNEQGWLLRVFNSGLWPF